VDVRSVVRINGGKGLVRSVARSVVRSMVRSVVRGFLSLINAWFRLSVIWQRTTPLNARGPRGR
jgi:hypothetical protein